MLTTSLNDIRAKSPCKGGWEQLLQHLGKTRADDKPLPILTVLENNGLEDALWVLDNCIGGYICRLVGADYAERVLPIYESAYPDDDRPRRAIELARDPDATDAELDAERVFVGGGATWVAARAIVVGDTAWDAGAAARGAARAIAGDAAGDAAWAAARAAGAAELDAQTARLRQYLTHGEAAKDMPWPETEVAQ